MQLSRLEEKAYSTLKRGGFVAFKARDLELLLGVGAPKAYNIIKALKRKRAIWKAGGFFALAGADEMAVGVAIHHPSYISFWSALSYYGLSDQTPREICLATTKYSKPIAGFRYVTISKRRFFGYVMTGNTVIAEKEKAVVDSLLFPKYAGGIAEIRKCVEAGLESLDRRRLADYALKVGSKALVKRLGFLLESMGCRGKETERLHRSIGKGYVLLDPSVERRGRLNARWLLDVNA
ncbi:MAG: hypothetical protein FJY76_00520 [Candidatus Aenigmarchaeota archaeon]|nr:hypothetical protein [Candidatus Aenigmarchaeota archaeon]